MAELRIAWPVKQMDGLYQKANGAGGWSNEPVRRLRLVRAPDKIAKRSFAALPMTLIL
jgi:hypothetical protein